MLRIIPAFLPFTAITDMTISGNLAKMMNRLDEDGLAHYLLPVGEELLTLESLLGKPVSIKFNGQINCIACGRLTKKSYSQGYCFPCSQRLAECDICIVRPEKCHYDQGTCREPEWGEAHCMQTHFVYLANTSGLKVGITRASQIPTRWIDQGATQALPAFRVNTRYHAGLVEVLFKQHVADRTDWRRMLKGSNNDLDLVDLRDSLFAETERELAELKEKVGEGAIVRLHDEPVTVLDYPVMIYPVTVTALNLDKTPDVQGTLQGIKGQYLILDKGVLNIRKYSGYYVEIGY